ncbi:hypothetical protein FHX42_000796 [Saccharopolyspora lacisalsi]|uniref:Uncharacterized protein n=1 Tax=Halosaccharopolyspora lacisalsi TaxID=1000566 RepID=A0A839DVM2_9PSEU|nr:hypothetical protein [Halosaccharopolyspora lacisalsi]
MKTKRRTNGIIILSTVFVAAFVQPFVQIAAFGSASQWGTLRFWIFQIVYWSVVAAAIVLIANGRSIKKR